MKGIRFNFSLSAFSLIVALFCFSVACSDDSTSANDGDDQDTDTDTGDIQLSDVAAGEGLIDVTGDVSIRWQGTAVWDDGGRFATGGRTYSSWLVTVTGENDEKISLKIVEDEDSSTMPGPDDGTYQVGTGQTENSVRLNTGTDSFLTNNSSEGSFTLTQASDGSVFEIELEAKDLEKGGIGSQDEFVNLEAVLKASSE